MISEVTEYTQELQRALELLIPQLNPDLPAPDKKTTCDIVDTPNTHLFTATKEGEIVGLLTLVIYKIPTGTRAWIEDVVVDQSFRNQGIGAKLTTAAIKKAKTLQVDSLNLTSSPFREQANRLYQKLGFEKRTTNNYRISFK